MATGTLDEMMVEKPRTLSVKLHMDVVESARIVAAFQPDTTMSDILSDILRPILARMEAEAMARRMGQTKPPTGKGAK